jgi:mRNA-degrading endonuclease RelE of RelBE toxin-antitoxin system
MRKFSIEERLKKILKKIYKKDKIIYNVIMDKMQEIMDSEDVNHYKNLRKSLQHLKRVYIKSSFVLTFRYIESEDKVVFYDLDHHDNIYRI